MSSSNRALLESAAADLVRKLGGTWRPGGAMCHCPAHEDDQPSLSVRIGDKSLLFKCFAGCTGIEVIQAIRRCRHNIPALDSPDAARTRFAPRPMLQRAVEIWQAALPLAGTPGERYLAGRSIVRVPDELRFHPATPLGRGPAVRFRPAIIAAIRDRSGLVAIQRIFLDRHHALLADDLPRPRLTLARPLAGAVKLARPGSLLGLAEGIETALSASILLGIPVWATLGNERLARIAIPDRVDHLILLPDADHAGRLAARRAHGAYARNGRTIETRFPWHGHNDWNDLLREEGEEGGLRCGWRPGGQDAPLLETHP
jgi:putative DNA primase/helicase